MMYVFVVMVMLLLLGSGDVCRRRVRKIGSRVISIRSNDSNVRVW